MSKASSPFVPAGQSITWERIDQGQDLRTNPGGQIIAPWAGHVALAPSNPGGFGTHYGLYTPSEGPYSGKTFYIGHAWALPGKVGAGDAVARTGHGSEGWMGNAKGIPGHVEIGFWPPGSMSAGSQVAPIVKGGNPPPATGSSSSTASSDKGPSFTSDPVGAIVSGLLAPIEQNALRMLLYGTLIIGGVALVVSGGLRATKPHELVPAEAV